jgi:uncharacterized protein YbjT (DUF2867 family)
MRVLVIGASRGIGREAISALIDHGHQPVGFSRTQPKDLAASTACPWIIGDAVGVSDVEAALDGIDAVIKCLGVTHAALLKPVSLFSQATEVLVSSMQRQGVKRLIAITGFGAGRSRSRIPVWQKLPFELAFGRVYRDKDIQERLITESHLDWTIARPGVLTNGPPSGAYKVISDPAQWRNGIVSRKDVADFLAGHISDRAFFGKDVVVVR